MNKNFTLKELADIGARAAQEELPRTCFEMIVGLIVRYPEHAKAREAFTKAILDAIGYELPKDEEREAFDAWCKANHKLATTDQLEAWKAGREELRKAQSLDKQPNEPAWIPWNGGKCPISDKVHRWQYKSRYGFIIDCPGYKPSSYNWSHEGKCDEIIAYRVWE